MKSFLADDRATPKPSLKLIVQKIIDLLPGHGNFYAILSDLKMAMHKLSIQ